MPNDICSNLPTDWSTFSPGLLFQAIGCGLSVTVQGFGPVLGGDPSTGTIFGLPGTTPGTVSGDVVAKAEWPVAAIGLGAVLALGAIVLLLVSKR